MRLEESLLLELLLLGRLGHFPLRLARTVAPELVIHRSALSLPSKGPWLLNANLLLFLLVELSRWAGASHPTLLILTRLLLYIL